MLRSCCVNPRSHRQALNPLRNGQNGAIQIVGFMDAAANVTTIGSSFGGGCFFENGVGTNDGSGTFQLDTFVVSLKGSRPWGRQGGPLQVRTAAAGTSRLLTRSSARSASRVGLCDHALLKALRVPLPPRARRARLAETPAPRLSAKRTSPSLPPVTRATASLARTA